MMQGTFGIVDSTYGVGRRKKLKLLVDTGFTLAELLICLLILAEIATFTIPKILIDQQNGRNNAIAKEDIATVSAAFQQHQLKGALSSSTTFGAFTQYMNYVSYSTAATVDGLNGQGSEGCDASNPCLFMHNGSSIRYGGYNFGGTNTTNAVYFHIDPDGSYSGTTNGPGKAVSVFIYYNGRLADEGNIAAGTAGSNGSYTANSSKVPTWFSW